MRERLIRCAEKMRESLGYEQKNGGYEQYRPGKTEQKPFTNNRQGQKERIKRQSLNQTTTPCQLSFSNFLFSF